MVQDGTSSSSGQDIEEFIQRELVPFEGSGDFDGDICSEELSRYSNKHSSSQQVGEIDFEEVTDSFESREKKELINSRRSRSSAFSALSLEINKLAARMKIVSFFFLENRST